jgi:hypothetical protein
LTIRAGHQYLRNGKFIRIAGRRSRRCQWIDHDWNRNQNNRAQAGNGGRIDGTVTPGPSMPGDAEIRSEDPKVDAKIKNICKGC